MAESWLDQAQLQPCCQPVGLYHTVTDQVTLAERRILEPSAQSAFRDNRTLTQATAWSWGSVKSPRG
jgi:hypothetical protein